METAKLYLIPSFLGEDSSTDIFSPQLKELLPTLTHFIVENEKTARKFIKFINPEVNQQSLVFTILDKRFQAEELEEIVQFLRNGNSVGLISEAGTPCIADPGNVVVAWAHEHHIPVIPLVGPSSILLALMASGMNGQKFEFHGYLPIDKSDKKIELKKIELESLQQSKTQIFMETPFRNNTLFEDLKNALKPTTKLCIASNITLKTEFIKTKTIQQWKTEKLDLHKIPTIFIIQA